MITRTEESDRGTYQCRAQNREDSADVSAVLDIYGMDPHMNFHVHYYNASIIRPRNFNV